MIAGNGTCHFRKCVAWTITRTGRSPLPAMGRPIPATHVSSFGLVHFRKQAGPCRQSIISRTGRAHFRKQAGPCRQSIISRTGRLHFRKRPVPCRQWFISCMGRLHSPRKRPGPCRQWYISCMGRILSWQWTVVGGMEQHVLLFWGIYCMLYVVYTMCLC